MEVAGLPIELWSMIVVHLMPTNSWLPVPKRRQDIIDNCTLLNLCSLAQVCRALNTIACSDNLWQPLCSAEWELKPQCPSWKSRYIDWLREARRFRMRLGTYAEEDFYLGLNGEHSVGKSAIAANLPPIYTTTVDGVQIKLRIGDRIGSYWLHGGNIVVYDITDAESFAKAQYWFDTINSHYLCEPHRLLLGNKIDQADRRVVTYEDGWNLAQKNRALFYEVSAKTGENICQAMQGLGSNIL
eukprot:TRINITY_DN1807_c0_g1_i11.p1 TRINITY_DN1807_c0_g1~~TRINITY_DN1807_c0_g1_i11.p1  ORF type:complete len:242 (-),score=8.72 TRINITY_DN1807_c0_g1_i11:218-943(-)